MTVTTNWRDTGTFTVGQELIFECPGHSGDGKFHKHSSHITWIDSQTNVVEVYSSHWKAHHKYFEPAKARDGSFYLKELLTK